MEFLHSKVDKNDIMLTNIIYNYPTKSTEWTDYLNIIYKDISTGEKHLKVIEKPQIEIYFTKDEYRNYDYNKNFIELDKVDKHICEYKNVEFYIAKQAGKEYQNYAKQCLETKNRQALKNLHKYPYVFGSDYSIEAWYRAQWLLNYDNDKPKHLTKQFLDIEVDGIFVNGFPGPGECPINMVTLVDEENKACYTFLLDTTPLVEEYLKKYENVADPKRIPGLEFLRNNFKPNQIQEFIDDIDNFIDRLHGAFDETYGRLEYNIFMFKDEKELITNVFKVINSLKRDFLMIWNMSFDIPFIIERMIKLKMDPAQIMCHPDFKVKECRFHKDTKNFQVANRGDSFKLSSYTKFMDQMIIYAATRKGQSELRSNKLTSIAKEELGDEKLDYSETANIKTLPYIDYAMGVMYNIKDTLLQLGIERNTNDLDNLYLRSYTNATDYDKVFKQTVFLKSRAYIEYLNQGYIIGNNSNLQYGVSEEDKEEEEEKFSGALVGDPMLNEYTGMKIFGIPSMFVFKNVIDMDFSSMYPNIIISHNIAPNTMVGKLIIHGISEDKYLHIENYRPDENEIEDESSKYDSGKDFVDNYLIDDIPSLAHKWFNLPNTFDVISGFEKEMGLKKRKRIRINKKDVDKLFIEKIKI